MGLTTRNRKERATGGVFSAGFSQSEALDIAADVYHGVRYRALISSSPTYMRLVRVLVGPDQLGTCRLVYVYQVPLSAVLF
jgi:hypothetical protein